MPAGNKPSTKNVNKWSSQVTSDATHPEPGLFKQDAETIATHLAKPEVSPKGPAQGMQMLNFYINRAGHNLSPDRHKVLEHAKELLHKIVEEVKSHHSAA